MTDYLFTGTYFPEVKMSRSDAFVQRFVEHSEVTLFVQYFVEQSKLILYAQIHQRHFAGVRHNI